MSDKSLRALRRESLAHAWRVSASTALCGEQTRLVVNAMRDTGAATELTSTAHLTPNIDAAIALAGDLAHALGRSPREIVWGPPVLATADTQVLDAVIAA